MSVFDPLLAELSDIRPIRHFGRISETRGGILIARGLSAHSRLGDRVMIHRRDGQVLGGEILVLGRRGAEILAEGPVEGVSIDDRVEHLGRNHIAPDAGWIGRVIDPYGAPLDGRPLSRGSAPRPLRAPPPPAARRKRLGGRLGTGLDAFNTLLPIVRGQRIGLFAGSGVGKTSLLGDLARGVEADVVVLALVGERGRELREFIEEVLGPEGLARSVVVTATSDLSPLARRRAALTAMSVAEHFRDEGHHVLLLCDSITRFAEAHREIALAGGESSSLRGFPPSTAHQIMALAERAGPGEDGQGDITALFTVLVAGSDMDEPVADILRGVLDGHVVLERSIAERGRFPAIDLLRSVSRSLPAAATPGENAYIAEARRLIGAYERAEMMVQAGLYAPGSDPLTDRAIKLWPRLDAFMAGRDAVNSGESFGRLRKILEG
ncbi:MAG: FliI/YscN family ATPase [Pararhodobacter sp.]|nr:FliI/YscN family ATPase [Pararhodobacter sp.]